MNQYEKPPFSGATSPGPTGVDEIPPFTNKDVFSRRKHNQVLRLVNALRRLFISPASAGRVLFSDHSVMLEIKPGTGTGGTGGGWNFRGEFDITQSYAVNDVVEVSTSLPPTDPDWVSGTNYTGLWLCILDNPAISGRCQRPIYPYPVLPNPTYWILIRLGVREVNVTDSVSGKKALFQCGDSYTPPGG